MFKILMVAFALLLPVVISAQQKQAYVVKAGEIPNEVLPAKAVYVFPVFKEGIVYFKDGSLSNQKLNYNILLGEMQFLTPKGDTLTIADPALIKNIAVDTLVFYYQKSYLQVIASIDSFKIAINQTFVQAPYQTRGGYDVPSATSSITTYGSITSSGSVAQLQVRKDVWFIKQQVYFVSDQFNHFMKADKNAFLNIFHTKKNIVQKYMNDNKINFLQEEDLKKLLKFCLQAR